MGWDKDKERSLSTHRHMQNRHLLWKINWIYCQSNQRRSLRNKIKSLKYLPLSPPFFPNFALHFLCFLPLSCARGQKRGAAVSSSPIFSAGPFVLRERTLHSLPLLQCAMLPMEHSSPQTPPMYVLPTGCCFPQAAQECLFHGHSPSEQSLVRSQVLL